MIKVKWLGQAGYFLDLDGTTILLDPYLSDIVFEVEKMPRMVEPPLDPQGLCADLLIATHDHMDHLDPVAVPQMDKLRMKYAGPNSCLKKFESLGIGTDNPLLLGRGDTLCFNGVELTGLYADHTADSIGLYLTYDGLHLYFTGDSLFSSELGEGRPVDVLFTCINGRLGNMAVEEAIELTQLTKAKVGIPNHYGMFAANTEDPQKYLDGIRSLGIKGYEARFNQEFTIQSLLKE